MQYVMVVLKGSVPMSFGGTEQPAAYGELVSIGGLNPDVHKKQSAAIAYILETKLSMPKSRYFLKFYDTKASLFGFPKLLIDGSLSCIQSSHFILPVCLGPSKSRICTVFTCFTPELDHIISNGFTPRGFVEKEMGLRSRPGTALGVDQWAWRLVGQSL
ncbi:hypothetical protein FNV43_RR20399 [Rhamnella rubrinervis]|uniref:Uncharacterized protein n=1 Tax=Rhamnella rubrinervis TaxID=2594499 RepID=A0A8K0E0B1_9ROSA|nr:hypothetical protein FNV43_RR20399 [Rhamnella rubrinervis]